MSRFFRYVSPVGKREATGIVADVYGQCAADLGRLVEPLMILSPAPDVLAGMWALMREAVVVGSAPRAHKEAVGAVVSQINACPWCVDAHTGVVYATGQGGLADLIRRTDPTEGSWGASPVADLLAWAAATRDPGAAVLAEPPFGREHTAEYVGTAIAFHFLNRMVSALLVTDFLPANRRLARWVLKVFALTLKRTVRRPRAPGASLELVTPADTALMVPAWADGAPTIGRAAAALESAALREPTVMGEVATKTVHTWFEDWGGGDPTLGRWAADAVAHLPGEERSAATLALLAGAAPYRITDEQVDAFRRDHPEDSDLVRVLAWGAMLAVSRIGDWISPRNVSRPGDHKG
jgi:AhpD family alkylhydroperoxidase